MNFGQAIKALKEGKKVSRQGWNGVNQFVVLSPGKENLEADKFFSTHLKDFANSIGGFMSIRPTFLLKTAQNDAAYWGPSVSDCLAEDWIITE